MIRFRIIFDNLNVVVKLKILFTRFCIASSETGYLKRESAKNLPLWNSFGNISGHWLWWRPPGRGLRWVFATKLLTFARYVLGNFVLMFQIPIIATITRGQLMDTLLISLIPKKKMFHFSSFLFLKYVIIKQLNVAHYRTCFYLSATLWQELFDFVFHK